MIVSSRTFEMTIRTFHRDTGGTAIPKIHMENRYVLVIVYCRCTSFVIGMCPIRAIGGGVV